MTYIYQEFPKVKYHLKHAPKTVQNAEEEKALGRGWVNTPNAAPKPSPVWAAIESKKGWFERWDWLLKRLGTAIGTLIAILGLYLAWAKRP